MSPTITNIERTGFFFLTGDRKYFVSFNDYPVFKKATIEQIYNFREESKGLFHWPSLDADIKLDALKHPERFPVVFA